MDVRTLQLNSKWVVQNQHLADTIIFPNLFGLRGDLELIRTKTILELWMIFHNATGLKI